MSSREPADLARVLLAKAAEDATAVREFADNEHVSDSVVGFHAQQAAEKLVKAVLASRSIEYAFSHDIAYLVELLDSHKIRYPAAVGNAIDLAPWAVEPRYMGTPDAPLDRGAALAMIEAIRSWAKKLLKM